MEDYENLLSQLSDLAGIIPEYYDIFGKKHVMSRASREAILSAMDLRVGTPEAVLLEIEKKRMRPWQSVLAPVSVISVTAQPYELPVHLPLPEGKEQTALVSLTIEDERGKKDTREYALSGVRVEQQQVINGQRFLRVLLPLPRKDLGYYRLRLSCSPLERTGRLIVTPDACYMPEQLQDNKKAWGVAVNLYALRSERGWGIGDLGDLKQVVAWLGSLGAGAVGINPLHEIPNTSPYGISPYSPISRLYRNFIYIDMETVPEMAGVALAPEMSERIARLRSSDQIDYQAVAAVKRELLEKAFEVFLRDHYVPGTDRGMAFGQYVEREGPPLRQHALFLMLSEHMRARHKAEVWTKWPQEYHSPHSPGVEAFRKNNEKRLLFFAYVQWLIDQQMAEASAAARAGKMAAGLYGDLAIGAVEGGSDVWMYQDVVAEQVHVGAPPDDFNGNGQDWGFPPMIPDKLKESGYDLFIQTIRKNMEHMGALRIDHAAGLFRLFWIPRGRPPADGGYVRCDSEDLLRIIALESVRNRTLVIGEDLGTITDEMRHGLQRFNILSYRLFYFERNYPDPSFLAPEHYPAMALAAVTTHDLPTLSGFWAGRDLDRKKQLGIIRDEEQYEKQKGERDRDRHLILEALRTRGLLPAGDGNGQAMTPELCRAIYRYLAASPAKLVLVSMDDVIGTLDQQNMPGTVSEYPNWRQKYPLRLEEIVADGRWKELAAMERQSTT